MIIKNILVSICVSLLISCNMAAGSFMGESTPTTSGSSYSVLYKALQFGGAMSASALTVYLYCMSRDTATLAEAKHALEDIRSLKEEVIAQHGINQAVKAETKTLLKGREGKDLDAAEQVKRITTEREAALGTIRGLNDRFAQAGTLVTDRQGLALLVGLMDGSRGEVRFLDQVTRIANDRQNTELMKRVNPDDKDEDWIQHREEGRQKLLTRLAHEEE